MNRIKRPTGTEQKFPVLDKSLSDGCQKERVVQEIVKYILDVRIEMAASPPHMPPTLTIATTLSGGQQPTIEQREASHLPDPSLVLHRTGKPLLCFFGCIRTREADFPVAKGGNRGI